MFVVTKSLNTSGNGLWSNVAKSVKVTGLDLSYVNDEGDFGELRCTLIHNPGTSTKMG